MRISDWSSDVCSSDLPGSRRTPAGWRSPATIAACRSLEGTKPSSSNPLCPSQCPPGRERLLCFCNSQAKPLSVRHVAINHRIRELRHGHSICRANRRICRRGRLSGPQGRPFGHRRSEEHTSELQSLMRNSYAVFCLKKKTKTTIGTLISLTIENRL